MTKPCTAGALVLALLVAFTAPSLAQETIGAPVVPRSITDLAQGSIIALNSGFTQAGIVTDWEFFNDNDEEIGRTLTPLLLRVENGNYIITGVGTPRVNDAMGRQKHSFDVVAGSDVVGPGYLFGWKDGTDGDAFQQGVIQFDFVVTPVAGTQQWFFAGHLNDLFPGSNLGPGVTFGAGINPPQPNRDYSVQATLAPGQAVDLACPCNGGWKSRGAYVSCVAQAAKAQVQAGLLTGAQMGSIVSARAKNSCGK